MSLTGVTITDYVKNGSSRDSWDRTDATHLRATDISQTSGKNLSRAAEN